MTISAAVSSMVSCVDVCHIGEADKVGKNLHSEDGEIRVFERIRLGEPKHTEATKG
jgi:hypothetical protein